MRKRTQTLDTRTDRFLPDKAIDLLDESCACTNLRSPEIEAYDKLAKKKEELEAKEKSIEDETEINFEELAQVKGELIRLNTSLEEAQKKLDEVQVTADDLSKVIELWTGIPAHKIAETEFTKLAQKVKSCDIEAWSPRQQKYFEVCSCSNLGDAQARRLKMRVKGEKGTYLPHTLNNTVVAPPRMLIAFLENNLQADGSVKIPEVLRPYMGGKELLIPKK